MMKIFAKVLIVFTAVIFLLMISGFIYQSASDQSDAEEFPAPGRIIKSTLGEIHINIMGKGDVTVILESGQGDCSLEWSIVQPKVAEFARVCSYDRPGLGWSEPVDKVLSADQIAENLHQVLKLASITPPYILVGHSVGGINVRSFARQYPDEITGLVLIESAHENQQHRLPPFLLEDNEGLKNFASLFKILVPFGVARIMKLADRMQGDSFPDDVRPAAMSRLYQTHFFKSFLNEIQTTELSTSQTEPPASLGDIPLIVLSRSGDNPGLPEEQFARLKKIWNEMQLELVHLSQNSKHIIAEKSGHYVHADQPELVVDAISQIVVASKNKEQFLISDN